MTLPTNFDNTELDLGYTGNAQIMESAIKKVKLKPDILYTIKI
jgi:hypothetical protein